MKTLCRLFIIYCLLCNSNPLSSQCNSLGDLLGSFEVRPGLDTCYEINIDRLQNNDLATNNALLGIDLVFSHNNIGDLLVELTSPSGQQVTLIGPITTSFPTNGSSWNVLFSECAGGAVPDPGIVSAAWDNADNWTAFTSFTGIYHPNSGCLEDFDTGPLNGTWKLRIINSSSFETAFVDRVGFTLDDDICVTCAAEAGTQSVTNIMVCTTDDLQLDLGLSGNRVDPEYTTGYFVVDPSDNIVNINLSGDFSGVAPGTYTICAFSVLSDELNNLISENLTYSALLNAISDGTLDYCFDRSDNCTSVTISQGPATEVIDANICRGSEYVLGRDTFRVSGSYAGLKPAANGDNCDTMAVLNLQVIDIEPLIIASSSILSCTSPIVTLDGSSSLQTNASSFLWSTVDGEINDDPSQLIIEVSNPGTYILSQTEGGCTLQTSFTVDQAFDVPEVTITADGSISCLNETVTLLPSSFISIVSANWTGPSNFTSNQIEPRVRIPGEYFGTFLASNGCQATAQYTLAPGNDQPTITAQAPEITCGSLGVQVNVSDRSFNAYRWTGPNGFVSNIAEPLLPSTGSYYLEVQDNEGCKGYTSVEVLGNDGSFEYEVFGEQFRCIGGRVDIGASTPLPGAIYIWNGPNGFSSNARNNRVIDEGTYVVEIRVNGCVVVDSVTLTRDISDLPEYDVDVENLGTCTNPLWRLTAIPLANEFQTQRIRWLSPGVDFIGSGSTIDITQYGRIDLYVNTFDGCVVRVPVNIPAPVDAPSVSLVRRVNQTCAGGGFSGSLEVTDNRDYSYFWEGPNSYQGDTSFIDNLEAGFYFLTVTDTTNGCLAFLQERVVGDTIPRTISLNSSNITCTDSLGQVVATVSGGGNSYEWIGPQDTLTTRNISTDVPGEYILTVTGGNGCISMDTAFIDIDTLPPNINLNTSQLECETSSAILDPGSEGLGLVYSWAGPGYTSSAPIATVFGAGLYNVTITGLNGCAGIDSVLVVENPDTPQPIALSLDTLNCINEEVTILGSPQSSGASFSWNGPGAFLTDEQNPSVGRPGEYVFTVISADGCIGFDTVEVIREIILPEVTFAFDQSVDCIDATAAFTGISTDPGAEFSWKGPNDYFAEGQMVEAIDTGIYTYIIRGSNNCVDSSFFQIFAEDTTFSSQDLVNCYERYIDISELSDTLSYDITWLGPNNETFTQTDFEPTEPGTYVGNVIGSSGCTANVTIAITFDTLAPTANIEQVGTIRCEDNEVQLNNNGSSMGPDYLYEWSTLDGQFLSSTTEQSVDIKGVGSYTLTVLDQRNGCTADASFLAVEAPQEFVDFDIILENPRCFGENNGFATFVQGFGGREPYTFSLDGILFNSENTFIDLAPATYTFIAKDSFGCIVEKAFTINETPALQLDLGDNIDVFLGNDVEIIANTNLTREQIESIEWQIENQLGCADCLSFMLSPSNDLFIELTLVDDRGCIVSDDVRVRVDETPVLFSPTVFSPNQDGVNDVFYIFSNPGVAQFRSIQIFDRWGERVFTRNNFSPGDSSAGWDGTISGSPVLPGVYVYTLEVEMITGTLKQVKGNVTVLR